MQVLAFTRRAGIFAVVLSGMLPGAAHAATAFGPPVSVSAPAAAVTDPHVFFSVDGRALLSWNARARLTAPYQEPRGRMMSVAADGTVSGGAALSDTLASPILREYPPEHALVLRERVLAREDRLARVGLSVAPVRPDASVDRGQVIATVTREEAPRLIVDEDGRAVLAELGDLVAGADGKVVVTWGITTQPFPLRVDLGVECVLGVERR